MVQLHNVDMYGGYACESPSLLGFSALKQAYRTFSFSYNLLEALIIVNVSRLVMVNDSFARRTRPYAILTLTLLPAVHALVHISEYCELDSHRMSATRWSTGCTFSLMSGRVGWGSQAAGLPCQYSA